MLMHAEEIASRTNSYHDCKNLLALFVYCHRDYLPKRVNKVITTLSHIDQQKSPACIARNDLLCHLSIKINIIRQKQL